MLGRFAVESRIRDECSCRADSWIGLNPKTRLSVHHECVEGSFVPRYNSSNEKTTILNDSNVRDTSDSRCLPSYSSERTRGAWPRLDKRKCNDFFLVARASLRRLFCSAKLADQIGRRRQYLRLPHYVDQHVRDFARRPIQASDHIRRRVHGCRFSNDRRPGTFWLWKQILDDVPRLLRGHLQ